MDDVIRRRDVMHALEKCHKQCCREDDVGDEWIHFETTENEMKCIPSAQPEIIHCKDCKHYMPYEWMWDDISRSSDINDYAPDEIGCEKIDHHCQPDGFCSFAERKLDATS